MANAKYGSDQFTNPAGQTFTRIANIYSSDNQLICTVTGNLILGAFGSMDLHATSSDESKCSAASNMSFGAGSMYLGYIVTVKA